MKFVLSVLASIMALGASAHAVPIAVDFEIEFNFDPNAGVGAGGFNTQNLVDDLFGPAFSNNGRFTVSGQLVYDPTTGLFGGNDGSAGFFNGISSLDLTFGGAATSADFDLIAANAGSSEFGFASDPDGRFCSDLEGCDLVGLPLTPSGNVIQTINDSDFFIVQDGEITTVENQDAIAFQVGATDVDGEFGGPFATQNFGDVLLDGFRLGFFYDLTDSPITDLALPGNAGIFSSSALSGTLAILLFTGAEFPGGLTFNGEVTSFTISDMDVSDVPIPGALVLFLSGLAALSGVKRRQRRATISA